MNEGKQGAHGVVYFDPDQGEFIQIRERYFNPNGDYDGYLKTGHFIDNIGDAKNNVPRECITKKALKHMINIEEVGLQNIEGVYYDKVMGEWKGRQKPVCPHCCRSF